MSEGFQQLRGGGAVATFSGFEADLLRSLASQLIELLSDDASLPAVDLDPLEAMLDLSGPTDEPDDPVLARLLPTAYRDDDEAAADFRRYTEGGLRSGKAGNAAAMIDLLHEAGLPEQVEGDLVIDVELGLGGALTWLKCFTDLRLAIATRLGIEEGDDDYWEALAEEDPRVHVHDIYSWLGYLQETLVIALERP